MIQFYFGPHVLHRSDSVLLLEPTQKLFYTLIMASPVDCTICHNLNGGRITIYSNAGTTPVEGKTCPYSLTIWYQSLFRFVVFIFFLPSLCHVVYANHDCALNKIQQ